MTGDKPMVMVNGLPGKMANIIARGIIDKHDAEYHLYRDSLTGPDMPEMVTIKDLGIGSIVNVKLVAPEEHGDFLKRVDCQYHSVKPLYAIDFTKGEGVANRNAKMYCENQIPFVMGTTGADYELIRQMAEETKTPCVTYPNMDKRLIAWMLGVDSMAKEYPNAFYGTKISLLETHQADKVNADGLPETSGTMKHMLGNLSALSGKEMTKADIISIRDPMIQSRLMDVPDNWIGWHAYHVFDVYDGPESSPTSQETLTFKRHGGESYRQGPMTALEFLVNGKNKSFFNTMPDVMAA